MNARDASGKTPLFVASLWEERLEFGVRLLAKGAREKRHAALAAFLEQHERQM